MFEIENLQYKHILNIQHLCLDRQITCLVGPSGSGKTTLLRMLNRMNESDAGRILYCGKNIYEMDPVMLRREIVMLGQTPIIYPGNIEENLQIGLKFSGRTAASKEELEFYLRKVGLSKELQESCATLSGGEKQRLCLARVMLMDAKVYLVDEPSSALDTETEQFVIDNLVTFVKEHDKTLVMVTHSSEVAASYPDCIAHMLQGDCGGYANE